MTIRKTRIDIEEVLEYWEEELINMCYDKAVTLSFDSILRLFECKLEALKDVDLIDEEEYQSIRERFEQKCDEAREEIQSGRTECNN